MNYPFVSIIIPTFNSAKVIKVCLDASCFQDYPRDKFEIILVDNGSRDGTVSLVKTYPVRIHHCYDHPPQVCRQRNLGARHARGDYIYILDHDMELPKNFLKRFAVEIERTKKKIDAWYIPEIVIASSSLVSKVRTLEKRFYDDTVISAVRLIKTSWFKKTKGYDLNLSGGPADWDMDIQLRLSGAKFGTLKECIYHHEEGLTFWKHITKKSIYIEGSDKYKDKWEKKNATIYGNVVKKQFSPLYRYFFVFTENGKWLKLLLPNLCLFIILYFSKITVGLIYILNKLKAKIL